MRRAWYGFGMVLAGMGGSLFTFGLAFGQVENTTDTDPAPAVSNADDHEICPYRRCHGFNPSRPYAAEEAGLASGDESIVPAANAEVSVDWEWETYQRWYEGRWYRDSFVLQAEEAPVDSTVAESPAVEADPAIVATSEEAIPAEPVVEETLEQPTPAEEAIPAPAVEAPSVTPEATLPEQSDAPPAVEPRDIYSEEYYEDPAPAQTPDFADESNDEPAPANTDGDAATDGDDEGTDGESWDSEDGEGEAVEGDDTVPADEGTEVPAEEPAPEEGAVKPEAAQPRDLYSEEYRADDRFEDAPAPIDPAPATDGPQPESTPEVAPQPEPTPEVAPQPEAVPAEAVPGYQEDYVPDYGTESNPPAVEETLPTEEQDIQDRQLQDAQPEVAPVPENGGEESLPSPGTPEAQLDKGIEGSFLHFRSIIDEPSPEPFALSLHLIQMQETCTALLADAMGQGQEFFRPVAESIREQLATLAPLVGDQSDRSADSAAAEIALAHLGGDSESAPPAGLIEGIQVTPSEVPVVVMTAEELDVARRNMLLQMGEALDHFATLLDDISQQLINQAYAVPEPDLSTAGRSGEATR